MLTLLFEIITTLAKGIEQIAYKMTLLSVEVYTLWVANKALSKYYKTKKARVYEEGILIVENI